MVVLGEIRQGLDCRVRAKRKYPAPDLVTGFGREGGKQSPVSGCDPCARDWGLLRSCSPPLQSLSHPALQKHPGLPIHSFITSPGTHFN